MKSISLPVCQKRRQFPPESRKGFIARISPYTSKLQITLMLPASSGLQSSMMFPRETTNSSILGELKFPEEVRETRKNEP